MKKPFLMMFFFVQFFSFSIFSNAGDAKDLLFLINKNPLISSVLTTLRDVRVKPPEFQDAANKIATILAIKAGEFLDTEKTEVKTPTSALFKNGVRIRKNPILVPVLRSGLSLLPSFQVFFKGATVGMVGVKRNEETAKPVLYYSNLPLISSDDKIIILEPMLATGGSLSLVISLIKEAGAKEENIIVATVISVMEGVERLKSQFPSIHIISAALDPYLNDKWYIVPGLGDFGDRYFGNDREPHFQGLKELQN